MRLSDAERDLVIRTILSEAGREDDAGKAAVAHVILNRIKSGQYGDGVAGVLFKPAAFEPWGLNADNKNHPSRHRSDSAAYRKAGALLDDALSGDLPDPTKGATHFLNEDIVRQRRGGTLPKWAQGQGLKIGAHTFHRPDEGPDRPTVTAASVPPRASEGVAAINNALNKAGGAGAPLSLVPPGQSLPFVEVEEGQRPRITVTPERKGEPDLLAQLAGGAAPGAAPKATAQLNEPDLLGTLAAQPTEATAADAAKKTAALPRQGRGPTVVDAPQVVEPAKDTAGAAVARWMEQNNIAGDDSWAKRGARLGIGAVRGVGDVADTLAQGIAATGDKGASLLSRAGVISPETAKGVTRWRDRINTEIAADQDRWKAAAEGSTLADIGRIGGQIAGTGPFVAGAGAALPAATRGALAFRSAPQGAGVLSKAATGTGNLVRAGVKGAGVGGASTALTSAASPEALTDQAIQGGAIGAALGPAGRLASAAGSGVAGLVTGKINPLLAQLAKEANERFGMKISPTQLTDNKLMRFMDSVLQTMPLSGFGKRTAHQNAKFHEALAAEMGEKASYITPQVVKDAENRLGKAYDLIEKNWGPIPTAGGFNTKIDRIARDTEFKKIRNIIDDIRSKIDPKTGTIKAEDYAFLTRYKSELAKALNSADGALKQDAQAIARQLDEIAKKANPKVYGWKQEADYQYSIAKAVKGAAEGSPSGNLSFPAVWKELQSYQKGNARTIGGIGQQFLREPGSSGTTERLMANALAYGIPAVALGSIGYGAYDAEDVQAMLAKGGAGVGALLAARYGLSPAIRSEKLANLMINRSLPSGAQIVSQPGELSKLLRRTTVPAAALTFRGSP